MENSRFSKKTKLFLKSGYKIGILVGYHLRG